MIEKDKVYYKHLFYIFLLSNILIFFILLFVTGGESASGLLYAHKGEVFMDFFNSLLQNAGDPYKSSVIYPPLSNCMYKLLLLMVPDKAINSIVTEENAAYYSNDVLKMQQFIIPFIFYILVTSVLMFYAFMKYKGGDKKEKLFCYAICVFSGSMLFAFERANSIIVAFIGMLFFLVLKDSKSKILKEIGLISLAVASAIKLYPIVLFVLILKDKKYKDLLRGLIYSLMLFVLPMFLFYDGFSDIVRMFENLSGFTSTRGLSTGVKLSFSKMIILPLSLFDLSNETLFAIGDVFKYVLSVGCVFASLFCKEKWKTLCACVCFIYGFQDTVATYVLILFIIPAIALIDGVRENKKINYVYTALLALIISAPAIVNPVTGEWTRFVGTKVTSYAILLLTVMVITSGVSDMCKVFSEKLGVKTKFTVLSFLIIPAIIAVCALFIAPGGLKKGDLPLATLFDISFIISSSFVKMIVASVLGVVGFAGIIFLAWWLPKDDKYNNIRQFIKFGLVGVSNTFVSLAVYYIFYFISEDLYFIGNTVGFVVSVLNAYYWNSKFVFKEDKTQEKKRKNFAVLLKTYVCYGSTFLLSEIMIIVEIELLNMSGIIAPIINLLVTIPLNYVLNKFFAYGEKRKVKKELPTKTENEEN